MNFWEHIIKLNDYSGMITLIQTIGTILLAIITIRLSWKANKMSNRAIEISEEALRVSKLAIEVSRELAQLPYKKDLWMSSYLDIENDKYDYYGAAEPPVRCGESHLSGLTEPPRFFII